MSASWVFPRTGHFQIQGRSVSGDNFAQEERTSQEILMREALQNPLDARAPGSDGPIQVRLGVRRAGDFDADYLDRLITVEYRKRLEASGGDVLPASSSASVLILEDFGTTGLQGIFSNQNVDGKEENWNAFWFREGEGAKSAKGSNGRAGQGKITYYRIGAARAVFGLTVRHSDGKQLLMGRSAFGRDYPYGGTDKFSRDSFWSTDRDKPYPQTGRDDIEDFRRAFKLARMNEPGLSLVIPFVADFDAKAAFQTIISEFYYPIARGRLEVVIGEKTFSSANIDVTADVILPDAQARKRRSAFTKAFRGLVRKAIEDETAGIEPVVLKPGWERKTVLAETDFPEGAVQQLREKIGNGERVFVRCPVTVKPKREESTSTWFDVYLEVPDELEKVEEAYIRRDLLIGSESHLANSSYLQKARGLTLIEHEAMSAFMADAEEPTHLKWNASRPRLAEDYQNPGLNVRAVRLALPRLLAFLSGGMAKRDRKTLARFFTKPAPQGSKHTPGGKQPGGRDTKPAPTFPTPQRKPFRLVTGENNVRVVPNGAVSLKAEELPCACTLEVAYEGLDLDPFKDFDPFDFDLADEGAYPIITEGARIVGRAGNKIEFDVEKPEFELGVSGFDSNIRLRARLNFTERDDGTAVDTQ